MSLVAAAAVGAVLGAAEGLWLRHRPYCDAPGRLSWLLVTAAVAAAAVLLPLVDWGSRSVTDLVLGTVFVAGGLAATWIDLDVRRLPDWLTFTLAGLLAGVVLVSAAIGGAWAVAGRAVAAGVVVTMMAGVCALFTSLGLGDVKLLLSIGVLLGYRGWSWVVIGLLLALVIGAVWACVLLLRGASRRDHLPLGPSFVVGAIGAFVLAGS